MITIIFGTRPQIVKLAPLIKELNNRAIPFQLIDTCQHYDYTLQGAFYKDFGIDIKSVTRIPFNPLSSRIKRFEELPGKIQSQLDPKTKLIVVFGDTDSSVIGVKAGLISNIPVAHIEALVRSGDYSQPEEENRIMVDSYSTFLFVPDARQGYVAPNQLAIMGCDLMLDALMMFFPKRRKPEVNLPKRFNLLTMHRANLTEQFLLDILDGINSLKTPSVWPLHPRIKNNFDLPQYDNIQYIQPVSYLEMLWLLDHCKGVYTDSGGLIRESYWMGKPAKILRGFSEWIGVKATTYDDVVKGPLFHPIKNRFIQIHGNGMASTNIVNTIERYSQ